MSYKSDINKATRISEAKDFPEVILIDNFSGCNLQCSICDHKNIRKYRKVQLMDFDLYKKIIDEVAKENKNARIWQIFFGDPFLCRDMPERIKYAKDKGLTDVVLNTNGVLMTAEKSKPIIIAGLDAMYVGIDAIKKETYNKIRIGGDFNKTVKNILDYRDLLIKYGREDQELYVQFVVCNFNEKEVDDFKKFWVNENVKVKIRPKVSWAGLVEANNLISNDKVVRKPCYWITRTFNVCADGEVPFCTVDLHCRVKCGNLKDKSIKEIWHGILKEYRAMQIEGRYNELPEICQNCSDWQSAYAEFY